MPLLKLQRSQKLLESIILAFILIHDWGKCTQNLEDGPPPPLVKHNSCQPQYSPDKEALHSHLTREAKENIHNESSRFVIDEVTITCFWPWTMYSISCTPIELFLQQAICRLFIPNLDKQSPNFFTDLVAQPISWLLPHLWQGQSFIGYVLEIVIVIILILTLRPIKINKIIIIIIINTIITITIINSFILFSSWDLVIQGLLNEGRKLWYNHDIYKLTTNDDNCMLS